VKDCRLFHRLTLAGLREPSNFTHLHTKNIVTCASPPRPITALQYLMYICVIAPPTYP
jgi:hypothetical protein